MASISELVRQEQESLAMPEVIQYMEQGHFVAYINKDNLLATLTERIRVANKLYAEGDMYSIARFLDIFPGCHSRESLLPYLNSRIDNLNQRITNIQQKEQANGNIRPQRS